MNSDLNKRVCALLMDAFHINAKACDELTHRFMLLVESLPDNRKQLISMRNGLSPYTKVLTWKETTKEMNKNYTHHQYSAGYYSDMYIKVIGTIYRALYPYETTTLEVEAEEFMRIYS
jgi:hypothetical protein